MNGNGVLDPNESGVAGETVFLYENLNGVLDNGGGTYNPTTGGFDFGEPHVVSAFDGRFTFTDLAPGTYRIKVNSASGFVQDAPSYFDVTVGQSVVVSVDVGEGVPSSFSGTLFNDTNGNGIKDPGETGVVGQTVYADLTNNGIYNDEFNKPGYGPDGLPLNFAEPSFVTDGSGNFTITNLGPGTYTFRLSVPQGGVPTGPVNSSQTFTVTLANG